MFAFHNVYVCCFKQTERERDFQLQITKTVFGSTREACDESDDDKGLNK